MIWSSHLRRTGSVEGLLHETSSPRYPWTSINVLYGTPLGFFKDTSSPLRSSPLLKSACGYQDILPTDSKTSLVHRLPNVGLSGIQCSPSSRKCSGASDSCSMPVSHTGSNQKCNTDLFSDIRVHQGSERSISVQPSILVPEVRITAECRVLGEGQRSFWAAIEISTKLSTTNLNGEVSTRNAKFGRNSGSQPWDITSGNILPNLFVNMSDRS